MTVRERLVWTYANLAMAHAAVSAGSARYGATHFMIRARLRKGLQAGTMKLGTLLDDERVKMNADRACAYCGSGARLSLDHLIPKSAGGTESADNVVWACRPCNSSKGDTDLLRWMTTQGRFPPLLLLRRYLKLAFRHFDEAGLMDSDEATVEARPFDLAALPDSFPPPSSLVLWTAMVSESGEAS
jgi:hypothetical protein